ncbi:RidA family protein [Halomonas sp. HNIBRBA4712]|uniref:RidA family protein n=1 Tax=Halomonas sp. HNIBRBA4712 TaxID=3373087 RepID=UPI0037460EBA
MPQFINDPTLPKPTFPGSHMVVDDHYVFISGLTIADIVEDDPLTGDVAKETHRIMRELERMLRQEELEWRDVVRVDIHLKNLGDIARFDSVYAEFFEAGQYPARTCTESPKLCGGASVEITLMASRRRLTAARGTPQPDADTGPE